VAEKLLIPLSATESAALMRQQRGRKTGLVLAFGTGGAALDASESPWAVPILAEMRGIVFQHGAGI